MRIGRQAIVERLLTEVVQLLLGQPTLNEGTGVETGGRVSLEKYEVAGISFRRSTPEVIPSNVVQRC